MVKPSPKKVNKTLPSKTKPPVLKAKKQNIQALKALPKVSMKPIMEYEDDDDDEEDEETSCKPVKKTRK